LNTSKSNITHSVQRSQAGHTIKRSWRAKCTNGEFCCPGQEAVACVGYGIAQPVWNKNRKHDKYKQ